MGISHHPGPKQEGSWVRDLHRQSPGPRSRGAAGVGDRRGTGRAMSQENVEVVRRHMQAVLVGDYEAALADYDPEVEFDASVRPEGHVYRGREGVAEAMRVWSGTWEDWKVEVKETIDAGDRVLMLAR